jgi:hypothetical protein
VCQKVESAADVAIVPQSLAHLLHFMSCDLLKKNFFFAILTLLHWTKAETKDRKVPIKH